MKLHLHLFFTACVRLEAQWKHGGLFLCSTWIYRIPDVCTMPNTHWQLDYDGREKARGTEADSSN